ncbi:hypothetical protein BDW74DRAFT_25425 [Aspergillus multicolor]|uniref:uncharacterized protein n=1 Tax=Aspergillus multicolor TaxID=41759 RepID=UPI003CCC9A75
MPRRSRPVEYDDVIDDMEEVYPSWMKGEPVLIDRDLRYGHGHGHRMPRAPGPPPPPPAVEILPDRRHHRGRSKPEFAHEDLEYLRDDVLAAERRARLDLDAYRAEEARKLKEEVFNTYEPRLRHQPQPRHRGRRRSRIEEEVYLSQYDSDHGSTDSESDEMDEYIEKKRSISRTELDPRKGPLPRSKSLKEEKRAQRALYGDGLYPKSSHSLEEYGRERRASRPNAVPRPRHRSHYHVDLESEETDESDESDESVDVVPQRGGPGVVRRNHVEQKRYAARRRETSSSSSSSSPESAGSSEEELPKVPLPVPVPPVYKESSRRHKPLGHVHQIIRPPSPPNPPRSPSPPRVPSLETVLTEREVRHRKKVEKAAKEEIEIERRSRESLQLSSDSRSRRKKEAPVTIVEPEVAVPRELIVEEERLDPRVTYKEREREIIEEHYRREAQPVRNSPHSDSTDDWAIISAPSRSKYSPEREPPVVDVREEPPRPRHKKSPVKAPTDDIIDPRPKGDNPRGKVGPRYIGVKDRRERLWTEITKDLVVREAIERAGYEYEEFDTFYYIFSYLHPDDVSALVEDSDNIRRERRRRIKEIQRERAFLPPPSSSRRSPNKPAPMLAERPPSPPVPPSSPRQHRENRREERRRRDRERDRAREEDMVAIEGGGRYRAQSGRW